MALVLKDRVKETTTTTGTGTYTLAGAVVGYQAFSVIGNANTTYYAITNGTDWEVGLGTYTLSGTALSRDTILESSNSGNAVNWSAGVKDIFCTYPAERSMYVDGTTITPAISARLGFTNLAQGSALSVLGVTGNATADNASIAAGTDNQVLRRSGTSVAFGAVNLASTDAVTGDLPFSNLAQGSALSVLGVTGNATADNASIAAGTDNQVLRRSGTALAFGAVNLASTDAVTGDLPFTNIAQIAGLSVAGRSANTTGDLAAITAAADHNVLRRSGTTIGFGAINLAQSGAVTGTLAAGNGGTGITSLGTGVATWLGTPSSTNLRTAVTDETGTGSLVFATSPTLVTPLLGTPTSGNLTNCTADGTNKVGYLNIPAVADKTTSYSLATGDIGKVVGVGSGGSITIPNSTFAAGDAVLIFNNTAGDITITCTITTAYIAGTDADVASVTLATRGVCNILFLSGTACVLTGNIA